MTKKAGKPKKSRRQPPTAKQESYVRGRIESPTKAKTRVARDAGYAKSTANHASELIEGSKGVRELFTSLLERKGISDELLAQRLYQGLFAMETKTATLEGKITDRANLVAFSERRAMLELVLKLKGHLIDKHELRMVRTQEDILEEVNG